MEKRCAQRRQSTVQKLIVSPHKTMATQLQETIGTVASNWVTTVQKIMPRTPETTGVTYTTTRAGAATVHLLAAAYTQL